MPMTNSLKDTVSAALIGALIGYLAHGHGTEIEWLLRHLIA